MFHAHLENIKTAAYQATNIIEEIGKYAPTIGPEIQISQYCMVIRLDMHPWALKIEIDIPTDSLIIGDENIDIVLISPTSRTRIDRTKTSLEVLLTTVSTYHQAQDELYKHFNKNRTVDG
jgi:hypothetical protein